MNEEQDTSVPFSGYRVTLVSGSSLPESVEGLKDNPVLASLRAGQPAVLSARDAAMIYEALQGATAKGGTFPLRFIPIRCNRTRALPFESVALSAIEILHIVHEGFFGALRCREGAIAAVQTCGALPVPSIGLRPLRRRAQRALAEHHVDMVIDREAHIHIRPAEARRGRAQA